LVNDSCFYQENNYEGISNDILTGSYGIDVFDYGFKNAGNDTITDFTIGNTKTDHGADIINLTISNQISQQISSIGNIV
jgi:D-lyxose ketol-isomerase